MVDAKDLTIERLRKRYVQTKATLEMIRAQYEAAQTYPATENHWGKADNLSPDAANNPEVRARLRTRSRFEIIENNPFLNGTLISICNDFAGSGIRLRITDMDVPRETRQQIERQWKRYQKAIKLRKLLWQMRMDKAVAGEAFAVAVQNTRLHHPVKLDYRVIEADCVTSPIENTQENHAIAPSEADGIKLDKYGYPVAYFVLDYHPGGTGTINNQKDFPGKWIPADQMLHIFRPMRGWHRGIPELTPSIPLCAVARRYTMALVRCAEIQASLAAVLESEIPNYRNLSTPPTKIVPKYDEQGHCVGTETVTDEDEGPMFDLFPIEMGSFNLLPQGFKMKTWDRVPVGQQYDLFIGALMREIFRPLLVPYNMAIGSSKDSNMASGVLDAGLYTGGQKAERYAFEEDVLEPIVAAWYELGCLTPGYFTKKGTMPDNLRELPDHEFGWDKVTIEHTDPTKVANAIKIYRESNAYTDRYIQEELLGHDYEEWQDLQREQAAFEKELAETRGITTTDGTNPPPEPSDDETEESEE